MKEYLNLKNGGQCKACPLFDSTEMQEIGNKIGINIKIMVVAGMPLNKKNLQEIKTVLNPVLPYTYITSIIKCKTTTPLEKHIKKCIIEHMIPQIAEMYPPVIILIGHLAEKYFPYECYDGKIFIADQITYQMVKKIQSFLYE